MSTQLQRDHAMSGLVGYGLDEEQLGLCPVEQNAEMPRESQRPPEPFVAMIADRFTEQPPRAG